MTDEQRPWEQELQRVAGDRWPTYLYSLDEAREICARVWREAQVHTTVIAGRHLIEAGKHQHSLKTALDECVRFEDEVRAEMLAERTRADAAESRRDRLAAALRELELHINGHMGWVHALTYRHNDNAYWDALVTQPLALIRAALADVPPRVIDHVELRSVELTDKPLPEEIMQGPGSEEQE